MELVEEAAVDSFSGAGGAGGGSAINNGTAGTGFAPDALGQVGGAGAV